MAFNRNVRLTISYFLYNLSPLMVKIFNIAYGGVKFSRFTDLQLVNSLQSHPFYKRCFSMIQVFMCTDIWQGLMQALSTHFFSTTYWLLNLSLLINWNCHQKVLLLLLCSEYLRKFFLVVHPWPRLRAYSLRIFENQSCFQKFCKNSRFDTLTHSHGLNYASVTDIFWFCTRSSVHLY